MPLWEYSIIKIEKIQPTITQLLVAQALFLGGRTPSPAGKAIPRLWQPFRLSFTTAPLRVLPPTQKNKRNRPLRDLFLLFCEERTKKIFLSVFVLTWTYVPNRAAGVYIIKTKFCISSRQKPCISSLRKRIQPAADDILALSRYTRQGGWDTR